MSGTLKPLFTWRSAIAESDLPATTRHVALTLSLYMSERGTSARPGPARLAADSGLHPSTVKEKLAELERLGWLRCVARGGRRGETLRANEYEATVPDPPLFDTPPVPDGDPSPSTTGRPDPGDPSPSPRLPVAVGDPISSMNSSMNSPSTRASSIADDFDAWYAGYPRHIDRAAALKAYRARRREGIPPERLTRARDQYAATVDDPAYAKYPSTFLAKDGPWSEWEHGPPSGAHRGGRDPLGAAKALVAEGVL